MSVQEGHSKALLALTAYFCLTILIPSFFIADQSLD